MAISSPASMGMIYNLLTPGTYGSLDVSPMASPLVSPQLQQRLAQAAAARPLGPITPMLQNPAQQAPMNIGLPGLAALTGALTGAATVPTTVGGQAPNVTPPTQPPFLQEPDIYPSLDLSKLLQSFLQSRSQKPPTLAITEPAAQQAQKQLMDALRSGRLTPAGLPNIDQYLQGLNGVLQSIFGWLGPFQGGGGDQGMTTQWGR